MINLSKTKGGEMIERVLAAAPFEKFGEVKIPAIKRKAPAVSCNNGGPVVVKRSTPGIIEKIFWMDRVTHLSGCSRNEETKVRAPGKNQQAIAIRERVRAILTQGFSKKQEMACKPGGAYSASVIESEMASHASIFAGSRSIP